MKIRSIITIVIITIISMIGLILVQFNWINDAIKLRENTFDQSVYTSLSKSLEQYEKFATSSFFNTNSKFLEIYKQQENISKQENINGNMQYIYNLEDTSSQFYKTVTSELNIPKELINNIGPNEVNKLKEHFNLFNEKWRNQAKLMLYESICVDEKIIIDSLKNLISISLKENNINSLFKITILDGKTKGVIFSDYNTLNFKIIKNSYKSKLFPESIFNNYAILLLDFPNKKSDILYSMNWMLIISFVFMALILIAFLSTIYIIIKQKKLGEMKSDFVNNMTHELKTPVATIALASNMLQNKKIQADEAKINKYAAIIKEENNRLLNNIEKVLQAAKLKKSKIKLNKSILDIHQLILNRIDNIKLLLEEVNGNIQIELDAENYEIEIDKTHFNNIINNLIENSIKYRNENIILNLLIVTKNVFNGIEISLQDNGIGIPLESVEKIFDKFYRVPTGNVHNVKGFGLGLNYVKELVEAHGGKVSVYSKEGEGSIFTIFLPFENLLSND